MPVLQAEIYLGEAPTFAAETTSLVSLYYIYMSRLDPTASITVRDWNVFQLFFDSLTHLLVSSTVLQRWQIANHGTRRGGCSLWQSGGNSLWITIPPWNVIDRCWHPLWDILFVSQHPVLYTTNVTDDAANLLVYDMAQGEINVSKIWPSRLPLTLDACSWWASWILLLDVIMGTAAPSHIGRTCGSFCRPHIRQGCVTTAHCWPEWQHRVYLYVLTTVSLN